jgi:hypothetical protein
MVKVDILIVFSVVGVACNFFLQIKSKMITLYFKIKVKVKLLF